MEYLLNHSNLCALIYSGQYQEALRVFENHYTNRLQNTCLAHLKLYLSSLNQSIYSYILFQEKVSLHRCCLENHQKVMLCSSASYAKELGKEILRSYSFCQEYLFEKYENPHIKEALFYIHSYLTHDLQLEDIARHVNLSVAYLCTLFKEHTGKTITDYIHLRRITLAKKLLRETELSLDEVSIRCGYNSYSYFSRQFKKYAKSSPNEFMKSYPKSKKCS